MATLVALLLRCGLVVNVDVLAAIVKVESGGNPLVLAVNGDFELVRQPRDLAEAVAMARWLAEYGHSFDAGLAQVNSANLVRLGLDVASVFDACANLRAASRVLEECHERAGQRWRDPHRRMAAAVSCYNSGDLSRGIANGYVEAVRVAGAPFLSPEASRRRPADAPARREASTRHSGAGGRPEQRMSVVLSAADVFAAPPDEPFRAARGEEHAP